MTDRLTMEELAALRKLDTPTVCNALEEACGGRRNSGFTVEPLVCPFPDLPPIVGYARTATIRSIFPSSRTGQDATRHRVAYYEYMGDAGPNGDEPRIAVLQDLDGMRAGFGAFWGEVQSNVHKALGVLGVVTDGCIRDIPDWADGFQALAGSIKPSHANVHAVDFGVQVNVCGMLVNPGDLIHADRHGAVVIPMDLAREVPKAAAAVAKREKVLLDLCKGGDFSVARLREAIMGPKDIH